MIRDALILLRYHLRQYIEATDRLGQGAPDAGVFVELGNIANMDAQDNNNEIMDRVVMSVVNLTEEFVYKNNPNYRKVGSGIEYRNAPVHLNLYVLFSANYKNYERSLFRLSQVVEFFQGNNVFNINSGPPPGIDLNDESVADALSELKVILDLHTLTFEQINDLWGSLGGKQVPFVLYKMRLIQIESPLQKGRGTAIETVRSNENIQ